MSKLNLKVPFGLKDGHLYEPRQVPLGKACGCICPGCGADLNAKHAEKNLVRPHFQHDSGKNCNSGRESAIHLAAKQLIEQHKRVFIPEHKVRAYVVDSLGETYLPEKVLIPAGVRSLTEVSLEKSMYNFRPDIVATTSNGTRFLIEIANTHFIDEEKQTKIERFGWPTIQVDVSEIEDVTFESLSKVLFEDSGKSEWIYHPKSEIIRKKLIESLRPKLDAADLEARRLAKIKAAKLEREKKRHEIERQQEQRKLEEKAQKIAKYKSMDVIDKLNFSLKYLNINQDQIPEFLNFKVRFENVIKVQRVVWQVAIYSVFINGRAGKKFKLDSVLNWLEERFDFEEKAKLRSGHKVAVWDFLTNLTSVEILLLLPKQWFEVSQDNLIETIKVQKRMNHFERSFNGKLGWSSNWPNLQHVVKVANKYNNKYRFVADWNNLAELLPVAKDKPVSEILSYYAKDSDKQKLVLQFFVEAGFVELLD